MGNSCSILLQKRSGLSLSRLWFYVFGQFENDKNGEKDAGLIHVPIRVNSFKVLGPHFWRSWSILQSGRKKTLVRFLTSCKSTFNNIIKLSYAAYCYMVRSFPRYGCAEIS